MKTVNAAFGVFEISIAQYTRSVERGKNDCLFSLIEHEASSSSVEDTRMTTLLCSEFIQLRQKPMVCDEPKCFQDEFALSTISTEVSPRHLSLKSGQISHLHS